jgi:hypothetical protein
MVAGAHLWADRAPIGGEGPSEQRASGRSDRSAAEGTAKSRKNKKSVPDKIR